MGVRVSSCTIILIDSIKIRNGFSCSGVLSGNRCQADIFIESIILLTTSITHNGTPNDTVMTTCPDKLTHMDSFSTDLL